MAMDGAEARRMLDGARRAPHLITQLVPAPNTLEVDATLQRLVAEGYVGEVLAVEIRAIQGRFVDPAEALHWRQDATVSGLNVMSMGIWYEALTRWVPPASRVMAVTKTAVPRRRDVGGAWHDVRIPDHGDILATLVGGAVANLRFSSVTALAPPSEVWIFGTDGTLRLEVDARRLSGGRRGDRERREIPIPAERRIGWRVEEEFVSAPRSREDHPDDLPGRRSLHGVHRRRRQERRERPGPRRRGALRTD